MGGILKGLSLAKDAFDAQTASKASIQAFNDADVLSYDDVPEVLVHYHALREVIDNTLDLVPSKIYNTHLLLLSQGYINV